MLKIVGFGSGAKDKTRMVSGNAILVAAIPVMPTPCPTKI